MSSVKINYDKLDESAKNARKLSVELADYSERITKKISNPVNSLPGNDKSGYASSIAANASAKIKQLNTRSSMFDTYAGSVEKFVAKAEKADKDVKNAIKQTTESYVGKRSKLQAFCDAVYNFLCVDLVNNNSLVRFLSNAAKTAWTHVTSLSEKAMDWFRMGKGKYYFNLIMSGTVVVLAIKGAIDAVAAIALAATPIGIAVAIVVAVAAVVGMAITIFNSAAKAENNIKALTEDDPAIAEYVGSISSVSDAIDKYDMGDKEDNEKYKQYGNTIDTIDTACGVIGFLNNLLNLGAVKNVVSGKIEGYRFSKSNIKYNIKKSFGFNHDTNSWELGKMFSLGEDVGVSDVAEFGVNVSEGLNGIYKRLEDGLPFGTAKDNTYSIGKIGYTVLDTVNTFSDIKVFKGTKTFVKPVTKVLEWVGVSEGNLDKAYAG